jgi:hypothetical protein
VLYPISAHPQENRFPSSLIKKTLGCGHTSGMEKNQMRRGTAKLEKPDCSGAASRLKPEKIMQGGLPFVQRSFGKSLSIPAKTKNIPVSNSTEMRCISMSPVATGKLSRLSSCINGENTAISTINRSTIFGVLRCISSGRGRSWNCGDYSTQMINHNNLSVVALKMRPVDGTRIAAKCMIVNSLAVT